MAIMTRQRSSELFVTWILVGLHTVGLFRHFSLGQLIQDIETLDPCAMEGQLTVPPGRNFSDNLSCPRTVLSRNNRMQCFNQSELCNGIEFCDMGSDEGVDNNYFFMQLDCK